MGALRERAHEVTFPRAEPLPVSTPTLQWGHCAAELLWEGDSGLASGAVAAQAAVGMQACSL